MTALSKNIAPDNPNAPNTASVHAALSDLDGAIRFARGLLFYPDLNVRDMAWEMLAAARFYQAKYREMAG